MRKISSVLAGACLTLFLASSPALALDVEGVRLLDTVRVSGQPMFLNGAGVRSKFFIKVYVGALYLSERASSAEAVVNSRKARRIELHMLRDMQASAVHEAMMKALKDNVSPPELARISPQLERLKQAMNSIGGVREGDVIQFDFLPGVGTVVRIGGDVRDTIEGDDLARDLLKIWLGPEPVQEDLKSAMMRGS
ncbi:chalcone isomerase-like protein [Fluviicoccus keumensis]|uniref:Chalcone isomerase-like protein n=1 Tax=Fluviicoccus keumensis TaxID=1435465 RepID=A0A4Q7Z897_9GAMM|nr:chalcone isomerase family protein [Fluviicoccus keumensis]RZU46742.1 chalcone isomerase-like protein [Fluviicoccus keumensis]